MIRDPLGKTRGPPFGDSFFSFITPAAWVMSFSSTSYDLVPPAISRLPLARNVCPAQNTSVGVGTSVNFSVAGSNSTVRKVPASNASRLLPLPAMIRTLPVLSRAAWIALIRKFCGTGRRDQWP